MLRKLVFLVLLCPIVSISLLNGQGLPSNNFEIIDSRSTKHVCKLPPTNVNANFFIQSSEEVLNRVKNKAQSTFQVDYFSSCDGDVWPEEAITAFEFALSIWSEHISSDVPIKVNANWVELEGNTLGSARPSNIVQISGAGEPDTWYSLAQLSALTGQPIRDELDNIEYDIDIDIQCNFSDWYFGTDAQVPENRSDFVTVVLHEIGHGLGFLGSMSGDNETDLAEWGVGNNELNPLIYDRFVVDGDYNLLIDEWTYPNPSSKLYSALVGEQEGIFFDGQDANRTLMGQRVDRAKLYSPDPFDEGSSYSHFDQTAFRRSINALMLPFIDRTFAVHTPGPLFCGVLSDMGWPLGEGCIGLIPSGILVTNQTSLNFGVLNSGDTAETTLVISNRDDAEAPLTGSLSVNSDQFSISGNSSFSIAPGGSQEVTVEYDPTTNERHQAVLSINHDASNHPSPYMISLEGESLGTDQLVELDQSYPNPFVVNNSYNTENPVIEFAISERSRVKLDLFTVSGQYLRPIVDADLDARRYAETVDMSGLSSGIYIYRIVVNGAAKSGKLMFVR
ncbi:MAG: choice-of-anchor D domain-containing protein [Balneolaceae bacterium]|nr:choice-of-anchor D domain-containing protein [Balneolaceae bacterium]MDR9407254.1 choice-of-anchor D domain-containing protein [Balneolaceae bacterium]